MSLRGLNILAVIPARGGSKGIPGKNLKTVGGVSLVGRAIAIVRSMDCIDRIVLSTDDQAIAEEGRQHGLEVPFLRPDPLASDTATAIDAWKHAWIAAEKQWNERYDISVYLEPTSPLRRSDDVQLTLETLLKSGRAAAATVSPTPAHFTPHKTLTLDGQGCIGFYLEGGADFAIRQKIPPYFHRNGICYAVRRDTLLTGGTIIESDCAAVVIKRPIVNIDEPIELELAEFLLARTEAEEHK